MSDAATAKPRYYRDQYREKKRTAVIRRPRKFQLVRRRSDGELFEAAEPGYPEYRSLFDDDFPKWFFRHVVKLPDKWWRGERYKRTGGIWECHHGHEFEAVEFSK